MNRVKNQNETIAFIDGSCRFNPHGEMGYAYIIELIDQPAIKYTGYVPEKIGNSSVVAEYKALEALLYKLIELGLVESSITIKTDSKLIFQQYNHGFKIRSGYYAETAYEVKRLLKRFTKLKIVWIPRDENLEADALASHYKYNLAA